MGTLLDYLIERGDKVPDWTHPSNISFVHHKCVRQWFYIRLLFHITL